MTLEEEAVGEGVKCHGKRYLGAILFDGGLTSISAAVPLLTNATKIIKYSKAVHSTCAATWRCCQNLVEVPIIALGFDIFGEYLTSCQETDYDLFIFTTK